MDDRDRTGDGEEHELRLSPLTLDRLAEIRHFLRETLTALHCESAVDAFVLAVDEVCANLVQHADVGAFPGPTRVTVRRRGNDAIIVVEDRGRPFDPAGAAPPDLSADWETRKVGGLGWFLVRQMVDDLSYHTTMHDDGPLNRLQLTRRGVVNSDPSPT